MPLAIVSLIASGVFVVLVVMAHVLKPEISGRWRMLSELSIGRLGWVMNAAFVAWAVSNAALGLVLMTLMPAWAGALLVVASIGPLGAAFFTADPITTPEGEGTAAASWHAVFGLWFIMGMPVVALVLAVTAAVTGSALTPWLVAMGALEWASLIAFIALTARWRRQGRVFGPAFPIGVPNRVFAACYVAWTVMIALAALPLPG